MTPEPVTPAPRGTASHTQQSGQVPPARTERCAFDGRRFAAVIFDVDGTLVDSLAAINEAWGTWLDEFGITPDPDADLHGLTSHAIVQQTLPEQDVERGYGRINELETSVTTGVVALPGTADALAALPEGRVAVATSGIGPVAGNRLEAAGLPAPDVVVTSDQVERGKPEPDLFLEAARRLGVDPRDCLVVEDAHAGVQAGHAAGCTVLGVRTNPEVRDLEADLVVDDLAHVRFQVDAEGVQVVLVHPA